MQTDTKTTAQTMTWAVSPAVYRCPTCQRVQVGPAGETPVCESYWSMWTGKGDDHWWVKQARHQIIVDGKPVDAPRVMEQIETPVPDGITSWVWECSICHHRQTGPTAPARATDKETWTYVPGACDHAYTAEKDNPTWGVFLPIKKAVSTEEAMLRWPRLTAHVICASLGDMTTKSAAAVVAGVYNGTNSGAHCDWIYSCYGGDSRVPVIQAFRSRKNHRGFMAHYPQAASMVLAHLYNRYVRKLGGYASPIFASWF